MAVIPDITDTKVAHEFASIFKFIIGFIIPMILSAMVPSKNSRVGAMIFCLIGIGFLIGMMQTGSSSFSAGLASGFTLASLKLLTNIRFF